MSVPETMGPPAYRLYQLAWAGLDWLYPPRCGGCGQVGSRWCAQCQANVQLVSNFICPSCGCTLCMPGICPFCHKGDMPYVALYS